MTQKLRKCPGSNYNPLFDNMQIRSVVCGAKPCILSELWYVNNLVTRLAKCHAFRVVHCAITCQCLDNNILDGANTNLQQNAYWGREGKTPSILDLTTTWRWVVSFVLLPRLMFVEMTLEVPNLTVHDEVISANILRTKISNLVFKCFIFFYVLCTSWCSCQYSVWLQTGRPRFDPQKKYSPQITSWSPQGMRVLRHCKVPWAEIMFVTIQRENIRPLNKEMNKAVTSVTNCPMFAVRLCITMSPYRWPIGSLPTTFMLLGLLLTALRTFTPRRDQLVICGQ
jgi:hypothetical protein